MDQGFFRLGIIMAALGVAPLPAQAAGYTSSGTAGETLATAEIISGTGVLESISGSLALTNNVSKGALFQIYIADPSAFSATMTFSLGLNNFDSQLFLFLASGLGLVADDDSPTSGGAQAGIPAGSSFLAGQGAGTYYLLLEGSGRVAMSLTGLIFPSVSGTTQSDQLVGPTGPGGGSALSGVTGNSNEGGAYRITLTGAQFVPEPSALLLLGLVAAGLLGRRGRPVRRSVLLPLALGMLALTAPARAASSPDAPDNLGLGLREMARSIGEIRPASTTRSADAVNAETRERLAAFPHAQLDARQRVLVQIHLDGRRTPAQIRRLLVTLGGQSVSTVEWYRHGLIAAWLPPKQLAFLARAPGIRTVQLALRPRPRVGKTTSQGVTVHQTTAVNTTYQGANISIGVLSDSYNKNTAANGSPGYTKAPADVTNGDLPGSGNPNGYTTAVSVVVEAATSTRNSDEGRAMLQIIHDLAPAAKLSFATSGNTEATFATNIKKLQTAGCKIICDDIGFAAEPMFSDGVVAQAVDTVAKAGVSYFSAYGNDGNNGYESEFRPVDAALGGTRATAQGVKYSALSSAIKNSIFKWHSFGKDGGGNDVVVQNITTGGDDASLIFQWDDPFDVTNGVTTDFDVLVFSAAGDYLGTRSGTENNISTEQPIESPDADLVAATSYKICLVETTRTGTKPRAATRLRYAALTGDVITGDYITSRNVEGYGHPSSALGMGIAAFNYDINPQPGVANHVFTPAVEDFSSNGPSLILFDSAGNRLTSPITRKQPVFAGVDNVNTSFFPPSKTTPNPNDYDDDGYPNFAGTSAAAIAALLLNAAAVKGKTLTPRDVRNLMIATTQTQSDADPDFSQAVAGPVALTATASADTVEDPNTFKITFTGATGTQLTQLVIDLSGTGLHFDPDATNGYPFTTGTTTGGAALSGTPTLSGGTSGNSVATFNFTSFDPGDTLNFGVDRDDSTNAGGNSADLLAGATLTGTVSADAASPYSGQFVNQVTRGWNYKAGYGLLDAQAALNLLLATP